MARLKPLSGFPEFLPQGQMVENHVVRILEETFELHGFAPISTRAVETMESLTRKGEIDKEVYVVSRLQADDHDKDHHDMSHHDKDQLGLHFDLTVPFARYVLENAGHLQFPFRRYQIQKVWRGERPQEGRYREFTQADIDIVGSETLAAHHDVEAPLVMLEALERLHTELGFPPVLMHVNNRKLSEGFYRGLGIEEPAGVLQRVDKYDKIGPQAVHELLTDELGLSADQADKCVALAGISSADDSFIAAVRDLGVANDMLEEGLDSLDRVVSAVNRAVPGRMVADLKIARGLDYYTGTVYETQLVGHESMGSVSSGGRYDALASDEKHTYPGVGISLGLTRLLAPMISRGQLDSTRSVPSAVLVAVNTEEERDVSEAVAACLRARGIACEVAPKADKYGKQIKHADRRGIPFVWFPGRRGQEGGDEVKDIRLGDQISADAAAWQPPAEDVRPGVVGQW